MKKWNLIYLWSIIIVFVIIWIPYFQNISWDLKSIMFFNKEFTFVSIYPWILFFGVCEWALIVLYIKTLIDDLWKKDVKKFDL